MESKTITKTIRELADEYDGNVEQLHRIIASRNAYILRLQEDNKSLNYHVEFQKLAMESAEDNAKTFAITMIILCAASAGLTVYNYLFG